MMEEIKWRKLIAGEFGRHGFAAEGEKFGDISRNGNVKAEESFDAGGAGARLSLRVWECVDQEATRERQREKTKFKGFHYGSTN